MGHSLWGRRQLDKGTVEWNWGRSLDKVELVTRLSMVWGLDSLFARERSWTEAKASEVSKPSYNSELMGQRAWAGLWSHGFQVSSPVWAQGIADFRLTLLQLGRKCGEVVGK